MNSVSRTFFKGLIAIIPLALTLYLLVWLAITAELVLGNIFKIFLPDSWYIPGFGFVLFLLIVYLFGSFLTTATFRSLFENFEKFLIQIPVIKSIYTAIRDVTSLFSGKQTGKFKEVVLVKVMVNR